MWYAVEHEKPEDVNGLPAGSGSQKHGQDVVDSQWTEEKWRERYLERMERREYVSLIFIIANDELTFEARVQIQILLYMFKISLPERRSPPSLRLDDASRSEKRKRTSKSEPVETVQGRLEAFMDKLTMWLLISANDSSAMTQMTAICRPLRCPFSRTMVTGTI